MMNEWTMAQVTVERDQRPRIWRSVAVEAWSRTAHLASDHGSKGAGLGSTIAYPQNDGGAVSGDVLWWKYGGERILTSLVRCRGGIVRHVGTRPVSEGEAKVK